MLHFFISNLQSIPNNRNLLILLRRIYHQPPSKQHHPPTIIHPRKKKGNEGRKVEQPMQMQKDQGQGHTTKLGNLLPLQFLIVGIPSSHCGDMISIPEHVSHGHSDSETNTDIKEDLTAQFSDDGGQVADLVGSGGAWWSGVFGPVDDWVLTC